MPSVAFGHADRISEVRVQRTDRIFDQGPAPERCSSLRLFSWSGDAGHRMPRGFHLRDRGISRRGRFQLQRIDEKNGRLCGIVSIGDVVKHQLDEIQREADAMREYISGTR